MIWIVKLLSDAEKEFIKRDGSIRKAVLKQLVKLEMNPFHDDVLGHKAGIDLTGYFKLYADNYIKRWTYEFI